MAANAHGFTFLEFYITGGTAAAGAPLEIYYQVVIISHGYCRRPSSLCLANFVEGL
jgi:hypothetical protein